MSDITDSWSQYRGWCILMGSLHPMGGCSRGGLMNPTRAAWFFVAGMAWVVLRGILVHAVPQLRADFVAQQGGLLLVVPLISVVASLTVPLFFLSFLRHHRFTHQRFLQVSTVVAAVASLLSFALVFMAFVTIVRGIRPPDWSVLLSSPWLLQIIPLLLVGSILLFLVVFSRSTAGNSRLRRAAAVAAVGAVIPSIMMRPPRASGPAHGEFHRHV